MGEDLFSRTMAAGVAGHVLDFDDTFAPGLAHLSAPTAPAALVLGAERDVSIGEVLEAYAAGFEAMGGLARASHPALYEAGWHPSAVCGVIGAATAAAILLKLDETSTAAANRLALLGAAGLRGAFGSDGKSLQVGQATAAGLRAALLVEAGAGVSESIPNGYEQAYGATWAEPGDGRAIEENWIKAYPCCLQTHSAIEAANDLRTGGARRDGSGTVVVHTRSRQAAPVDVPSDGLQAKFSLPYTVAFTLLHGPPGVGDFYEVDAEVARLAGRLEVVKDDSLGESEALVDWNGDTSRVKAATGSPANPMTEDQLRDKMRRLVGNVLDGVLDDLSRPASEIVRLL